MPGTIHEEPQWEKAATACQRVPCLRLCRGMQRCRLTTCPFEARGMALASRAIHFTPMFFSTIESLSFATSHALSVTTLAVMITRFDALVTRTAPASTTGG